MDMDFALMSSPMLACLGIGVLFMALRICQNLLDPSRELGSFHAWRTPQPPFPGAAVVITGAGTGLGRAVAERLAKAQWTVYAGVISPAEVESFADQANIIPKIVDVCSSSAIKILIDDIKRSQHRLVAVINNANIMSAPGPLEFVNADEGVSKSFNVGVQGTLRLVQAALPLMRASTDDPRIIIISSGAGALVVPLHGVYGLNKFALEACGDGLRRELPDAKVVLIQPSMIATQTARTWPQLLATFWPKTPIPDSYAAIRRGIENQHNILIDQGMTADQTARGVCHALVAKNPPARYRVGVEAVGAALVGILPASVGDFITWAMIKYYASVY
jgi:NAD(P)-dependent dehydrogenase (short-subunit alcohol dehydrogenase family)